MVGIDMKKGFAVLLLLLMSSLVMAVGSEVSADFNIGGRSDEVARDYVPNVTFWDTNGTYIIGAVIVLIIVIVFFKSRGSKVSKKKVSKRRSRKRK